MENKLTIASALTNSNQFVKKVADQNYADKRTVLGEQLPKITVIREVNFILIYILLQSWKGETKKIKSPYFNFENEEVKNAMEHLMNILSRNIEIEREDFEALLKKSYQLTLLYFKNPIIFLGQIFQEKVTIYELKELNKFLKADFISGIIRFLEENNQFEILLEEIEPSSVIVPNSIDFLVKLDLFLDNKEYNKIRAAVENKFKTDLPPNLNDTYQKEQSTLNDQHTSFENKSSINNASTKVESILKSIPLNEQFKMTNEVFGGMKAVYDSFIEKLEQASSFADAVLIIDNFVSKTEHIEPNKYLQNMIERKFLS